MMFSASILRRNSSLALEPRRNRREVDHSLLVTFAVKEEARPFQNRVGARAGLQILVTGVGSRKAERAIRAALNVERPKLVLSCGFAGGLSPELKHGAIVFAADDDFFLAAALSDAGARRVRFYCATKVLITAEEKRALWQSTGAGAVEMESEVIRAVCRERQIPSATVRVISDPADEDLPLDFNRFFTPDQEFAYGRLAWAILKSPAKVVELLRFQRQTRAAAENLATCLANVLAGQ